MLGETAADSRGGGAGRDPVFRFPPLPLMPGPTCRAAPSPPIPLSWLVRWVVRGCQVSPGTMQGPLLRAVC